MGMLLPNGAVQLKSRFMLYWLVYAYVMRRRHSQFDRGSQRTSLTWSWMLKTMRSRISFVYFQGEIFMHSLYEPWACIHYYLKHVTPLLFDLKCKGIHRSSNIPGWPSTSTLQWWAAVQVLRQMRSWMVSISRGYQLVPSVRSDVRYAAL